MKVGGKVCLGYAHPLVAPVDWPLRFRRPQPMRAVFAVLARARPWRALQPWTVRRALDMAEETEPGVLAKARLFVGFG